jgi:colanic acid/amylovoran biosynthesis glycosyltransferase
MKVTICSTDHTNHTSGVNSWLRNICISWRDTGIDVEIILFTVGNKDLKLLEYFKGNDFSTIQINFNKERFTEDVVADLNERLSKNLPDVFIPSYVPPAWYATKWLKKCGVSVIGILHSDDQQNHEYCDQFFVKKSDYQINHLVVVSKFLEDKVRSKGVVEKKSLTRIPYGVPIPNAEIKNYSKPLKILYAGRLVEYQKQISLLTKAFCEIGNEFKQEVQLVIYGSGSRENVVRKLISDNDNFGRVKFGGFMPSDQLTSELSAFHCTVLLSDYEGLPLIIQEAMAQGLVPIILKIDSGINELINDGSNGFIVNNRGSDLIHSIGKLVNDNTLLKNMSNSARNDIENYFSIDGSTKKWLNLFNDVRASKNVNTDVGLPSIERLPKPTQGLIWGNKHRGNFISQILRKITRK